MIPSKQPTSTKLLSLRDRTKGSKYCESNPIRKTIKIITSRAYGRQPASKTAADSSSSAENKLSEIGNNASHTNLKIARWIRYRSDQVRTHLGKEKYPDNEYLMTGACSSKRTPPETTRTKASDGSWSRPRTGRCTGGGRQILVDKPIYNQSCVIFVHTIQTKYVEIRVKKIDRNKPTLLIAENARQYLRKAGVITA